MQVEGTIQNLVASGGYQGQHGYIWTFTMTIQTSNGPMTGEIGSKSQVYPLVVGASIMVEVSNDQNGQKFKKVNPKYANQNQQQTNQQAPPQNTQQASPQPVNVPVQQPVGRDYDKENHGKCMTVLIEAVLSSGVCGLAMLSNKEELTALADLATICMNSYLYRSPIKTNTHAQSTDFSEQAQTQDGYPV